MVLNRKFRMFPTYSRAEALNDGVLIDVTNYSDTFGIPHPVALTETLSKEAESHKWSGRDDWIPHLIRTFIDATHTLQREDSMVVFDWPQFEDDPIRVVGTIHQGDKREPVITLKVVTEK